MKLFSGNEVRGYFDGQRGRLTGAKPIYIYIHIYILIYRPGRHNSSLLLSSGKKLFAVREMSKIICQFDCVFQGSKLRD